MKWSNAAPVLQADCLITDHLELHRSVVQAVASQDLHGLHQRRMRRVVLMEQITTKKQEIDLQIVLPIISNGWYLNSACAEVEHMQRKERKYAAS